MTENDIVEIIKDTADRWHTMFYSVYVKQHYGDDITVFYEAVAKAIIKKADWCKHHSHDVSNFYEPKEEINETLNGRTIFKDEGVDNDRE